MDSPTHSEQMQTTLQQKDTASAADEMTTTTDEAGKYSPTGDVEEANQSKRDASRSKVQETAIQPQDDRLHGSGNSSPDNHSSAQHPHEESLLTHQPSAELHHEHMFSSNSGSDVFGSGDPDLDQLYRMSANRFGAPESPCDDLPMSFSLPYSEDKGAKMYSCNICSFKTIFKNSLVNHQAVHSDARPWICDICDYAAKRKQDLKKHLQTMHGMIVDSLALKPGANPLASSTSSSGLESPVETKPLIVNNMVVPEEPRTSGTSGLGHPHLAHSASVFAQQQAAAQFGHPLPSSAMMNQHARSIPMPAVGKFISDKFPFNQFYTEAGMPSFAGEAFMNQTRFGLRASLKNDREAPHLDSQPPHRFHSQDDGGSRQSATHRYGNKDTAHSEGREGRQLPSVSEVLPKDKQRGFSTDEQQTARSPENSGRLAPVTSGRTREARAVDPISPARVSSVSEEVGTSYRWKRASGTFLMRRVFRLIKTSSPEKQRGYSRLVQMVIARNRSAVRAIMVEARANQQHCFSLSFT